MNPLVLHINGMSCGHCLHAVSSALAKLPGVVVKTVRIGRAEVEFDPAQVSPEAIASAVSEAGYAATLADHA
jgi:copper chaperone CopZ